MIRAVLFDLDDTLLVDEPDVAAARLDVTRPIDEAHGLEVGALATAIRVEARRRWRSGPLFGLAEALGMSSWEGLAADFVGGHPIVEPFIEWAPSYRVSSWEDALAVCGVRDVDPAAVADEYRTRRRASFRLFADSVPVLTALRERGLRIGILTNGPPDLQREKAAKTGLLDLVDGFVASGEAGVGKPDPAVFRIALAGLGVLAAEAVMVGDSLTRDVAGARAAGVRPLWRPAPHLTGGGPPADDPGLERLSSLVDVLDVVAAAR